jgi:hypothetical protein
VSVLSGDIHLWSLLRTYSDYLVAIPLRCPRNQAAGQSAELSDM